MKCSKCTQRHRTYLDFLLYNALAVKMCHRNARQLGRIFQTAIHQQFDVLTFACLQYVHALADQQTSQKLWADLCNLEVYCTSSVTIIYLQCDVSMLYDQMLSTNLLDFPVAVVMNPPISNGETVVCTLQRDLQRLKVIHVSFAQFSPYDKCGVLT